jgi:hypothetical protein
MKNDVLLDKLSELLMVGQCGWQLCRVVGSRTTAPELQARYQEFGEETDRHRTILTQLLKDLGGNPDHVSPTARVAELGLKALTQEPPPDPERLDPWGLSRPRSAAGSEVRA